MTNIEAPGIIHQTFCALGRLIVLMGALKKGKDEINEMFNVGVKKYFQTTVKEKFCFLSCSFDFDKRLKIGLWTLGK